MAALRVPTSLAELSGTLVIPLSPDAVINSGPVSLPALGMVRSPKVLLNDSGVVFVGVPVPATYKANSPVVLKWRWSSDADSASAVDVAWRAQRMYRQALSSGGTITTVLKTDTFANISLLADIETSVELPAAAVGDVLYVEIDRLSDTLFANVLLHNAWIEIQVGP
jgi:hypothetical protein